MPVFHPRDQIDEFVRIVAIAGRRIQGDDSVAKRKRVPAATARHEAFAVEWRGDGTAADRAMESAGWQRRAAHASDRAVAVRTIYAGRSIVRMCIRPRYSPRMPSANSCAPEKIATMEARNGNPATVVPLSR